jgi:DNA-binding transcriptional MerR regulator
MNLPQAQLTDEALEAAGRRAGKSAAAFRTISEVASDLDVPPHVLRFWESKFSQIRPLKRGGGRRYYRPEDIELLRRIRTLLYRDGYTIKGVQKLLRSPGVRPVADEPAATAAEAETALEAPAASPEQPAAPTMAVVPKPGSAPAVSMSGGKLDPESRAAVETAIEELSALRDWLATQLGGR